MIWQACLQFWPKPRSTIPLPLVLSTLTFIQRSIFTLMIKHQLRHTVSAPPATPTHQLLLSFGFPVPHIQLTMAQHKHQHLLPHLPSLISLERIFSIPWAIHHAEAIPNCWRPPSPNASYLVFAAYASNISTPTLFRPSGATHIPEQCFYCLYGPSSIFSTAGHLQ